MQYNPNPDKINTIDCAIRALCAVTGKTWDQIFLILSVYGYRYKTWGNVDHVWGAYLRDNGWHRAIIPDTCPECYTVSDFAHDHPVGAYVLGTGTHAVAVVNGVVCDSWDSTQEIPIFYFYR